MILKICLTVPGVILLPELIQSNMLCLKESLEIPKLYKSLTECTRTHEENIFHCTITSGKLLGEIVKKSQCFDINFEYVLIHISFELQEEPLCTSYFLYVNFMKYFLSNCESYLGKCSEYLFNYIFLVNETCYTRSQLAAQNLFEILITFWPSIVDMPKPADAIIEYAKSLKEKTENDQPSMAKSFENSDEFGMEDENFEIFFEDYENIDCYEEKCEEEIDFNEDENDDNENQKYEIVYYENEEYESNYYEIEENKSEEDEIDYNENEEDEIDYLENKENERDYSENEVKESDYYEIDGDDNENEVNESNYYEIEENEDNEIEENGSNYYEKEENENDDYEIKENKSVYYEIEEKERDYENNLNEGEKSKNQESKIDDIKNQEKKYGNQFDFQEYYDEDNIFINSTGLNRDLIKPKEDDTGLKEKGNENNVEKIECEDFKAEIRELKKDLNKNIETVLELQVEVREIITELRIFREIYIMEIEKNKHLGEGNSDNRNLKKHKVNDRFKQDNIEDEIEDSVKLDKKNKDNILSEKEHESNNKHKIVEITADDLDDENTSDCEDKKCAENDKENIENSNITYDEEIEIEIEISSNNEQKNEVNNEESYAIRVEEESFHPDEEKSFYVNEEKQFNTSSNDNENSWESNYQKIKMLIEFIRENGLVNCALERILMKVPIKILSKHFPKDLLSKLKIFANYNSIGFRSQCTTSQKLIIDLLILLIEKEKFILYDILYDKISKNLESISIEQIYEVLKYVYFNIDQFKSLDFIEWLNQVKDYIEDYKDPLFKEFNKYYSEFMKNYRSYYQYYSESGGKEFTKFASQFEEKMNEFSEKSGGNFNDFKEKILEYSDKTGEYIKEKTTEYWTDLKNSLNRVKILV